MGKKPSIMSQTQLQGTHCLQSWFYWPWDLKQDFPFISSSPEGSSHYNLFPAWVQVCPPRRNHCLRQPLNEDRLAWLSHCTLAKLSIVFVCWSTLSSPLCFNIAILSEQVSSVSKSIYSVCLQAICLTSFPRAVVVRKCCVFLFYFRVHKFCKAGGCCWLWLLSVPLWVWINNYLISTRVTNKCV